MSRRQRKVRKKRVVLILVEGDSEVNALSTGLVEAVGEDEFKIFFAKKDKDLANQLARGRTKVPGRERDDSGGDLFGESNVNESNLTEYIDDWYISTWLHVNDRLCLRRKDICGLYHVIDMDGSYIPDDCVGYGGSSRLHNTYRDTGILTSCKTSTEQQRATMAHRRKNIDAALKTDAIKCKGAKMPYKLYFFSSNLDHYIHNDANLPGNLKVVRAEDFSNRYFDDPNGYRSFFIEGIDGTADWQSSWDKVRSGMASIQRGSNYGFLIDDLIKLKLELMETAQG